MQARFAGLLDAVLTASTAQKRAAMRVTLHAFDGQG